MCLDAVLKRILVVRLTMSWRREFQNRILKGMNINGRKRKQKVKKLIHVIIMYRIGDLVRNIFPYETNKKDTNLMYDLFPVVLLLYNNNLQYFP